MNFLLYTNTPVINTGNIYVLDFFIPLRAKSTRPLLAGFAELLGESSAAEYLGFKEA